MDKFSGLAQKLQALAGRGTKCQRAPGQPRGGGGGGVSHPCLPGMLMSPNKATGKWFVIPLCQRARVLEQTVY